MKKNNPYIQVWIGEDQKIKDALTKKIAKDKAAGKLHPRDSLSSITRNLWQTWIKGNG